MRRLGRDQLFQAGTDGLERLAQFMGLALPQNKDKMTIWQYRAWLVNSIQRAEKLISKEPKGKNMNTS